MAKKIKDKRSLNNIHLEYDENGYWNQERNRIKGAIRKSFRLSPQMFEILQKARFELPPAPKKDGTPGKKNRVRFECKECGELFSAKNVQVDHNKPAIPLHKPESEMTYDEIVRGVFCKTDNLQVLCSTPIKENNGKESCHRVKTNEENFIRDRFLEYQKENGKLEDFKEINRLENEFRLKYKEYLKEKERLRLEKEQRKLERENKRKFKNRG